MGEVEMEGRREGGREGGGQAGRRERGQGERGQGERGKEEEHANSVLVIHSTGKKLKCLPYKNNCISCSIPRLTLFAKLVTATPSGCSLLLSASPTMAVKSCWGHTLSTTNSTIRVTTGLPWVSVPVLSNTTVFTCRSNNNCEHSHVSAGLSTPTCFTSDCYQVWTWGDEEACTGSETKLAKDEEACTGSETKLAKDAEVFCHPNS